MTDMKKLKDAILKRGIKLCFVAEKIGMTKQRFSDKLNDGSDFKASEMFIIKDLLHLTDEETRAIFFVTGVDKNSTEV